MIHVVSELVLNNECEDGSEEMQSSYVEANGNERMWELLHDLEDRELEVEAEMCPHEPRVLQRLYVPSISLEVENVAALDDCDECRMEYAQQRYDDMRISSARDERLVG